MKNNLKQRLTIEKLVNFFKFYNTDFEINKTIFAYII